MHPSPPAARRSPIFHAMTGCETVSLFGGRGKKLPGTFGKVFPKSLQRSRENGNAKCYQR